MLSCIFDVKLVVSNSEVVLLQELECELLAAKDLKE